MQTQGIWTRVTAVLGVVALAFLLVSSEARGAQPAADQSACVQAYVDAQTLRKDGKLIGAREQLRICVQDGCSPTLREQCGPWLEEVAAGMPSVILVATDESGRDTLQVPVELDGAAWLSQVPPRAVEIDPGEHRLRAVSAGGTVVEKSVVIREGEKNRRIAIDFAVAEKLGRLASLPVLISGGVTLAALAGFAGFGIAGKLAEGELVDTCAPGCAPSDVDDVRLLYLLADISLGVAVVGAATAVGLWMLLPGEDAEAAPPAASSDVPAAQPDASSDQPAAQPDASGEVSADQADPAS